MKKPAPQKPQPNDPRYTDRKKGGIRTRNSDHNGTRQHRFLSLDKRSINEKDRTLEVSFSSECREVPCYDWDLGEVPEVLSHADGAVDLSPFVSAGSVLRNHNSNEPIAVPVDARIDVSTKRGKAIIHFPAGDPDSERAWNQVRSGLLRGVSVGYEVLTSEKVPAGRESSQGHAGPCIVATKWRVHEISLTPVPADSSVGVGRGKHNTPPNKENAMPVDPKIIRAMVRSAGLNAEYAEDLIKRNLTSIDEVEALISKEREKVNASTRAKREDEGADDNTKKDDDEEDEEERSAPKSKQRKKGADHVAQERERQKQIRAAVRAAKLGEDVADDLCERDVSIEKAREIVLAKLAENDHQALVDGGRGRSIEVGAGANEKRMRSFEANIARRAGVAGNDDYKGVEQEHYTLIGVAREYLRMIGVPGVNQMSNDIVAREIFNPRNKFRAAAANATGDLASLFANIQNKALIRAYNMAQPTWRKWCKKGSLSDFKLAKRIQLTDFAQLRETGENGEIFDSKIADRGENIQLAYYARSISFTWQMFVNDDLDALSSLPAWMGKSAAQLPSRLVYAHLLANPTMGDGVALFHAATHGNLETGAGSNLDDSNKVAALKAAIKAFRKQTAPQAPNDTAFAAEAIDIEPRLLLVPPEHEYAAYQLVNPNLYVAETQFFKGKFDIAVEPRLSNTGYTGYSLTAWYLTTTPDQADIMEVAFLDGNEAPRSDSWEDFDRLALRYRAILPCGVKALDWRGIVKSAGA